MNTLPETAAGTLALMPSTAVEVARFSKNLIEAVRSGDVNPLQLIVQLHALTKVYEEVREEIEENVLREADKHAEKKFNAYGAIVERCVLKTEYLYETSGDSQWEELDAQIKGLVEQRKGREAFLRAIKDPVLLVNKDAVEELVKPPVKRTKDGVKIYLANLK